MKKAFLGFVLGVFSHFTVAGQVENSNTVSETKKDTFLPGQVRYATEPGLTSMLERYKKINYNAPAPEGFRVQIFADGGNNAKDRATTALEEFQGLFPEVVAYLTYQQPNFKVRCGDYLTKAEARGLQKRIANQYPGAYVVKDHIKVD